LKDELAPLARQFVAALPRAVPPAIARLAPLADVPLPMQPCIRDVWHDHVLFNGDRVTGLIDFGAMRIDTPATDVARLLGSLQSVSPPRSGEGLREGHSRDDWHEGLAAYSAIRPLSAQESLAVPVLDTSGTILAGCNWIRWIYIDGRQFINMRQVVLRFARLLERLQAS
jgi:homoserine kinase type II